MAIELYCPGNQYELNSIVQSSDGRYYHLCDSGTWREIRESEACRRTQTTILTESTNPQETTMALFEVAFTLVPNVKAQEAGAEETLLVAPVAVVAKDAQAAISRVAADNATKIQGIDGSTLKTHVRAFPTS